MTTASPTSPASAPSPKWRVHLVVFVVVCALGIRLAVVSSAEHWGRADWVSMDGWIATLMYVYLPAHAVMSSIGVKMYGTSTARVLAVHVLTPAFLGGIALGLISVLLNAAQH